MIDLTPVFQAIIALVAALITYKLIPGSRPRPPPSSRIICM